MSGPALLEHESSVDAGPGVQWYTAAELVPSLEHEARQRAAIIAGSVAVADTVEVQPVEEPSGLEPTTLLSNLQNGARGDARALEAADLCVGTDVAERLYKVKKHTEVPLARDQQTGQFGQSGDALVGVSINTFRYGNLDPTMWGRTEIEAGNSVLFGLMQSEGVLEEYDALVASMTTKNQQTQKDFNFFVDTDTVSLQLLSGSGDDFTLETALVAGKVTSDADSHALKALNKLAADHDVDLSKFDEDTMHSVVILIPKGSLENGLASVVEEYDDAAGGTFYGLAEPRQNYAEFAQRSLEQDFEEIVNNVRGKLLEEVDIMRTPEDAVRRLDYWSGKFGVEVAVLDESIDARVFGKEAAPLIDRARYELRLNNYEAVEILMGRAKQVEDSSSCPIRSKEDAEKRDNEVEAESQENQTFEDCEFVSKECPHCNAKNVKTVCKDGVFYGACGCNSKDGKAIARDGKSVEVEEHENQVSLEKLFEAVLKQGGPKNDPVSAANN